MNEELGVNYQLDIGDNTYEEMVNYFTQMSLDEFEIYVREAYQNDVYDEELQTDILIDLLVVTHPTDTITYYFSSDNYFYITPSIRVSVTGDLSYTGEVVGYGIHYENSYPQYRLDTCSYSFSNTYKTITYSFKCVRYVSPNLISTGYYTYSGSNTLS